MVDRAGRVVLGVTDSMPGLAAVRWAVAEARLRGVPLCAVRTWRPVGGWRTPYIWQWWPQSHVEDARGAVDDAFQAALGALPGDVAIEVLVAEGMLGEVLVSRPAEAAGAPAVPGGRRLRGGPRRPPRPSRALTGRRYCQTLARQ